MYFFATYGVKKILKQNFEVKFQSIKSEIKSQSIKIQYS